MRRYLLTAGILVGALLGMSSAAQAVLTARDQPAGGPQPAWSPSLRLAAAADQQGVGHLQPLEARLLVLPQGLRVALRDGIAVAIAANQPADGVVAVSVSRAAAKRAQIKTGRAALVTVGRGTTSQIVKGTVVLRLRLSRAVASKLAHLPYLTLKLRLSLVGAGGQRLALGTSGTY